MNNPSTLGRNVTVENCYRVNVIVVNCHSVQNVLCASSECRMVGLWVDVTSRHHVRLGLIFRMPEMTVASKSGDAANVSMLGLVPPAVGLLLLRYLEGLTAAIVIAGSLEPHR
jgi:hypothetical protein